jgi:hypothetical protein
MKPMPKITKAKVRNNTEAFEAIVNRHVFHSKDNVAPRMFGEMNISDMELSLYVAYSYGYHYPMCAYDYSVGKWFFNEHKYSPTTQRHKSGVLKHMTEEDRANVTYLDPSAMSKLVMTGSYANMVANRMGHKIPPNNRTTDIRRAV